jgi:sugar phosphate isomerase/epimerase
MFSPVHLNRKQPGQPSTDLNEEKAPPAARPFPTAALSRRDFLQATAAALPLLAGGSMLHGAETRRKTEFQIACMTLPYSSFPLERALTGIESAGYKYIAWGTTHREEDGRNTPVMGANASEEEAAELGQRCRDLGLEPVLMFSMVYPEAADAMEILTQRIRQASAAAIPQVLTFGQTQGGRREVWVQRFKVLGPIARDHGVTIVIKQHGGSTGTGEACAAIAREVNDPGIKVNYDAGNVMDYLDLDPLPDIRKCADQVRSFCIKDHRNFPQDQDCGPGFGEIDHYKLLHPVAYTGLKMPLACENIFAPVIPRPKTPEGVDALARRAREFLEVVVAGLQS